MSAAHDFEDLHRLLDPLSPEQARRRRVLADTDPQLHRLLEDRSEPTDDAAAQDRLLALAGIWHDGPVDAAARHDELIRERFTRES